MAAIVGQPTSSRVNDLRIRAIGIIATPGEVGAAAKPLECGGLPPLWGGLRCGVPHYLADHFPHPPQSGGKPPHSKAPPIPNRQAVATNPGCVVRVERYAWLPLPFAPLAARSPVTGWCCRRTRLTTRA